VLRDCDPGDATKDSERGADKPRAALFFTAYTPKTGKKPCSGATLQRLRPERPHLRSCAVQA